MKILIMGAGFVGTATAVSFAQTGHKVVCFDTDAEKIKSLSRGEPVFFEPGLKEALSVQLEQSNLRFSVHAQQAIEESEVIFICVGTPSTDEGGADLSYVKAAAMTIGRHMNGYKLIVNKSTVPVATCRKIRDWVVKGQTTPYPFDVASNPEFLREGNALADALSPHRIVVGSTTERCTALVKQLYKSFHCPLVLTDPATAEFIKYAANSFLATKISYMNELARFCDELGVSIQDVAHGIGLDPRIGGEFLRAGIGYGGSCFPKDVKALLHMANEHGIRMSILEQVKHVNETQYLYLLDKINREAGELRGESLRYSGSPLSQIHRIRENLRHSLLLNILPMQVPTFAFTIRKPSCRPDFMRRTYSNAKRRTRHVKVQTSSLFVRIGLNIKSRWIGRISSP